MLYIHTHNLTVVFASTLIIVYIPTSLHAPILESNGFQWTVLPTPVWQRGIGQTVGSNTIGYRWDCPLESHGCLRSYCLSNPTVPYGTGTAHWNPMSTLEHKPAYPFSKHWNISFRVSITSVSLCQTLNPGVYLKWYLDSDIF